MPVATSACPLDQAIMSCGMASILSVGFDRGRTMGRSHPELSASMTSCVKAPWSVDVPMRMVGWTRRTVSSKPITPPWCSQSATSEALRAYAAW